MITLAAVAHLVLATPPAPVELSDRVASTLELLAKMGGASLILWGVVEKVAKPYTDWRRRSFGHAVRTELKPELDAVSEVTALVKQLIERADRILSQQALIFHDFDLMLDVVTDNRDRINETNALLDATGLASTERRTAERRKEIETMFATLEERRKARLRRLDA